MKSRISDRQSSIWTNSSILFGKCSVAFLLAMSCFVFPFSASAESNFSARLSPLPVTLRTVNKITGVGNVEATLTGSQLTISGKFQGLSGKATTAHIHMGKLAIPGPAIADLKVSLNNVGEISGQVQLSSEQIIRLHEQGLYIQIHSDAAAAGNLRGWLIQVEGKNND